MIKVIEDENFLSEKSKKFIDNVLLGLDFPYYFNYNIDHPLVYLLHTFRKAPEERDNEPVDNSYHMKDMEYIFNEFCKKNKIKYKEILRCAVNLTSNVKRGKSDPHNDHDHSHKTLIIYLNNADGNTIILDENNKVYKKVKPKKFKGLYFTYSKHYQYYPKNGTRAVAVYTFI
jgi:hypothetical protein